MIKKIIIIFVVAVILVMMAATVIEKFCGTPCVGEYVYGSWWFVTLWAMLTVTGCAYIIKQKLYKRMAVMMMHCSFIVILIGALTTFLTAESGTLHLRQGNEIASFQDADNNTLALPFCLSLKKFSVTYYPGTDAPLDYVSVVSVHGDGNSDADVMRISMNNIGYYGGYRFFQSAYDSDMKGTVLGVSHDAFGVTITYCGYILLLVSVLWVMVSRKTRMRNLYRIAAGAKTIIVTAVLMSAGITVNAMEHHVLPKERADNFGELLVLYNDRVCPVNTLAMDFVTKLSGSTTWDGLSANEIFTGWIFYFSSWEDEKIIRIKDKEAQKTLGIDGKWASFNDFWNEYNEYKLEAPLKKAYKEGDEKTIGHLRDADEKFNLIRMFYSGELLRIFPYPVGKGKLQWFCPGTLTLPKSMSAGEWGFIRKSMDYLTESIIIHDDATADMLIEKIGKYQRKRGGDLLPSESHIQAELTYNTLQSQHWPVFMALAMGLLVLCFNFLQYKKYTRPLGDVCCAVFLIWLTVLMGLRWYVSGHLPMSNGYETMVFLAWAVLLITLCLQGQFPIFRAFGLIMAAFALLVAMISGQDPQITQLMPVLQSPLLSIHVAVIMFSYALLTMTFVIALMTLIKMMRGKFHSVPQSEMNNESSEVIRYTALSQLLLYPAVMCLVVGIFIGAVWANVSWGKYWSWDSKETWALITLMIYAAPLHLTSLPAMRKPKVYHIFMVLAFLSVLFTYFGVNYLLTGMHSYA